VISHRFDQTDVPNLKYDPALPPCSYCTLVHVLRFFFPVESTSCAPDFFQLGRGGFLHFWQCVYSIYHMLEICMKDCERTNYPLEYQVPMHSLKQSLVSEWTSAISPPTWLWWRLSAVPFAHDQVWRARVVIKKYLFPEHSHVCLQPRFPLWCYQGLAGSHAMLRG
jgi:hypothetical protein